MKQKKTHSRLIEYLSIDAIKLILQQPDTTTKKGIRDLALLALMYDSGARVSEIINLTPSMLKIIKPCTVKVIGKGNKARLIPLVDPQVNHLKKYMNLYNLHEPKRQLAPLFFNSRSERLTRSGVGYILNKYVKAARKLDDTGIPARVNCHMLRHSRAMHLLQAGTELIYIRDILGHVSVETAQMYARVETKYKRIALEKAYTNMSPEIPIWENNNGLLDWLKSF